MKRREQLRIDPCAQQAYRLGIDVDVMTSSQHGRWLVDRLFDGVLPPDGHNPVLWASLTEDHANGVPDRWIRAFADFAMQNTPEVCRHWLDQSEIAYREEDLLRVSVMIARAWRDLFRTIEELGSPPKFDPEPASLRKHVSKMAESMHKFAKQLAELEREAVRRGHADTERGRAVRRLASAVARDFTHQVSRAVRLSERQAKPLEALIPRYEVGDGRYNVHLAPLPNIFAGYAVYLKGLAAVAQEGSDKELADGHSVESFWHTLPHSHDDQFVARDLMIRAIMIIWRSMTDQPPTCTPGDGRRDDRPSPFVRFVWNIFAHRMGIRWARGGGFADCEGWGRRLGIYPLVTPKTLRGIVRSMEI